MPKPGGAGPESVDDPHVRQLAELFLHHPAWVRAAQSVRAEASSAVYFRHRPGEAWRLVRRDGRSRLLPGVERDPDLVFRFPPAAIERLAGVRGGVGEFAVALFELILAEDPTLHVDLRVAAPFGRLLRRGYVTLLARAGPPVLAFGAAHGVSGLGALRRLVKGLQQREPAPWEASGAGPNAPDPPRDRGE